MQQPVRHLASPPQETAAETNWGGGVERLLITARSLSAVTLEPSERLSGTGGEGRLVWG